MTIAVINAKSKALLEGRLPEGIEPVWYEGREQLLELAPQAEVAWLDPIAPALAAEFIAAADKLVWYMALSSGVDWLPLPLIADRKIELTNGSGIHAQSVAEYAVMGMLAVAKGWRQVVRAQDRHEWLAQPPGKRELLGSQVLVVGAGEIGGRIAEILCVFGAEVTGVRRRPGSGDLGSDAWRGELGRFDWVIAIVPSTPETQRMFGEEEFAAMKPGAVFLNFARGTVIEQDALLAAIDSGHLGGAFLDVTEPEPLPADHPLWSRENIHISMHLAGRAQDSLFERGSARFLSNLRHFVDGRPLEHRVDLSQGY